MNSQDADRETLLSSPKVVIFLSAVTQEFGEHRDYLRHVLTRQNVEVKIQEDFINSGTDTLEKLDGYIAGCDIVVQIAGKLAGALPAESSVRALINRHPFLSDRLPVMIGMLADGTKISYTHWEGWLALYHRKPLVLLSPQLALATGVEASAEPSQAHYLSLLQKLDFYPTYYSNLDNLVVQLLSSALLDILVRKRVSVIEQRLGTTPASNLNEVLRNLKEILWKLGQKAHFAEYAVSQSLEEMRKGSFEAASHMYRPEGVEQVAGAFLAELKSISAMQNLLPRRVLLRLRLVQSALRKLIEIFEDKVVTDQIFNRNSSSDRLWVASQNRDHYERTIRALKNVSKRAKDAAQIVERTLPERQKLPKHWPFVDEDDRWKQFKLWLYVDKLQRDIMAGKVPKDGPALPMDFSE